MSPNFKDFKEWFKHNNKPPKIVGESVMCRTTLDTLNKQIKSSNEIPDELLKKISENFVKNGGKILKQEKDIYLIETNLGNFKINKKYIKIV